MGEGLHCLNQLRRPLPLTLHRLQMAQLQAAGFEGTSEHARRRDGILNRIVDANSADG